jgi:hypothetical protein
MNPNLNELIRDVCLTALERSAAIERGEQPPTRAALLLKMQALGDAASYLSPEVPAQAAAAARVSLVMRQARHFL